MSIRKPLPEEIPAKGKLVISTLFALCLAGVLIVTVILPAERGIDPSGIGSRLHLTRMGIIKTELAKPDAPQEGRPTQTDSLTITLDSGEGREVKMEMQKGYTAHYQWSTVGGPVYHDTHGDPYSNESVYVSYSKADSIEKEEGSITALYGGYHGWYWVNNGDGPVEIKLTTHGEYEALIEK